MCSLGVPFEQINGEQLVKRFYNWVSPIDAAEPNGATLTVPRGNTQTFQVQSPAPFGHSLDALWTVDGNARGTGEVFSLDSSSVTVGPHVVEVTVSDATALVRSDPSQVLSERRNWNVTVTQGQRVKTFTLTPCRVLDTRLSTPLGPIAADATRSILVAGDLTGGGTINQGGATTCGVPVAATGVYVNVVAVNAGGPGHLTIYPFDTSLPLASTLNFTTGQTIANGVLVPICPPGASCDFDLNNTMGPAGAHLVVDITGYLAPAP